MKQICCEQYSNFKVVCSVDNYQLLSGGETIFGQGGDQKIQYKIIKFRFALKLPSICINQKCSIGVGSLHILYSLNPNGDLGASPQRLATLGIYY